MILGIGTAGVERALWVGYRLEMQARFVVSRLELMQWIGSMSNE